VTQRILNKCTSGIIHSLIVNSSVYLGIANSNFQYFFHSHTHTHYTITKLHFINLLFPCSGKVKQAIPETWRCCGAVCL